MAPIRFIGTRAPPNRERVAGLGISGIDCTAFRARSLGGAVRFDRGGKSGDPGCQLISLDTGGIDQAECG
jgi:hypothetical protein